MKKSSSGKNLKRSRFKRVRRERIRKALLKFTPRQLLYRKYRLEGMTIFAAAMAAGYSYAYARSHACQRVERVVKVSIIDELDIAGATNRRQAREVTRIAFEAMETEECVVYRQDADGEIALEKAKTLRPNDYVRLRALQHISQLKRQIIPASIMDAVVAGAEYTRVTFVLEKEPDAGKTNLVDVKAKSRVALTHE